MAEPKSKPHIVLIPGAWHKPVCFSIIIPKLEAAGYTVHTTQMPSVTESDPPKDLTADIAALRQLVDKAIGPGDDVVVIPHSWAGTVVGSALVGYSKGVRERNGKRGGVDNFVCLTSEAGDVLYNDLPQAERAHWVAQSSRTHGYDSFKAKVTGESWLEIPTYYLICENDQAIPLVAQEAMTAMVKDKGGDLHIERISSGHSPFLSRPDETVQWIRRVAGERS